MLFIKVLNEFWSHVRKVPLSSKAFMWKNNYAQSQNDSWRKFLNKNQNSGRKFIKLLLSNILYYFHCSMLSSIAGCCLHGHRLFINLFFVMLSAETFSYYLVCYFVCDDNLCFIFWTFTQYFFLHFLVIE